MDFAIFISVDSWSFEYCPFTPLRIVNHRLKNSITFSFVSQKTAGLQSYFATSDDQHSLIS